MSTNRRSYYTESSPPSYDRSGPTGLLVPPVGGTGSQADLLRPANPPTVTADGSHAQAGVDNLDHVFMASLFGPQVLACGLTGPYLLLYLWTTSFQNYGVAIKDHLGGPDLCRVPYRDTSKRGASESDKIFSIFSNLVLVTSYIDAAHILGGNLWPPKNISRQGIQTVLQKTGSAGKNFRQDYAAAALTETARELTQTPTGVYDSWAFDLGGMKDDGNRLIGLFSKELTSIVAVKRAIILDDLRPLLLESLVNVPLAGILYGNVNVMLPLRNEQMARQVLVAAGCLDDAGDYTDPSMSMAATTKHLKQVPEGRDYNPISNLYTSNVVQLLTGRLLLLLGMRAVARGLERPVGYGLQKWKLPHTVVALAASLVHAELILRLNVSQFDGIRVVQANVEGLTKEEETLMMAHVEVLEHMELKAREPLGTAIRFLEVGMGVSMS